jgi:hypothetical protein
MVIGDFNLGRLPVVPTENQAPLLIDSHAPKTGKTAGKGFQPVAGRDSQVGQEIGRVKLPEPQEYSLLNISRLFLRTPAIPDLFGFLE